MTREPIVRPTHREVAEFLGALPPAVLRGAQETHSTVVGLIARGPLPTESGGDWMECTCNERVFAGVDVLVNALLTVSVGPLAGPLMDMLVRVAPGPSDYAHRVHVSLALVMDRTAEPRPSFWVDPAGHHAWIPLTSATAAHEQPDRYRPSGEIRWIIDPAHPMPMAQRALRVGVPLVLPRLPRDPRPPLIADTIIGLCHAALPYGNPWVDAPLKTLRQLAAYDPFLAVCALLNRSSQPLGGLHEMASFLGIPRTSGWPAQTLSAISGLPATGRSDIWEYRSASLLAGVKSLGVETGNLPASGHAP